jgi:hypothetical protein
MSNHAANPAAQPNLSVKTARRAIPNPTPGNGLTNTRSSRGGLARLEVQRVPATFLDRDAEGNFGPGCVCRSVSRLLFGHGFGANPAPCGSSLFCFHCVALRVTVSLQILFGKYAAKISHDPP